MPIMPVTDTGNRASWENSRGGRQQTISAHPHSSARTAILLISGGAAALLALGIFIWFSRRSETAQTVTPVLSAAAADIAPAPVRPATETVATAAAPSPPSIEAVGKDGASAAAEPSAKASPEPTRPFEASTSAREPAPDWRTRKSAPPAPPALSPAPAGKGLTDFGGRR